MLNEADANESVLKLKALEAFAKAADGQATKIIIPSEIQGIAGLAEGIIESVKNKAQLKKRWDKFLHAGRFWIKRDKFCIL